MLGIASERNSFSANLLRESRITREMILSGDRTGPWRPEGQLARRPRAATARWRNMAAT